MLIFDAGVVWSNYAAGFVSSIVYSVCMLSKGKVDEEGKRGGGEGRAGRMQGTGLGMVGAGGGAQWDTVTCTNKYTCAPHDSSLQPRYSCGEFSVLLSIISIQNSTVHEYQPMIPPHGVSKNTYSQTDKVLKSTE